jgi:hypothetical protein
MKHMKHTQMIRFLSFSLLALIIAAQADEPKLPTAEPVGRIETVATFTGPMPTGVTVSREGRIFVNFPRWGDPVELTVAELKDGKPVPYPDAVFNRFNKDRPADSLVSVQSVVVDPLRRGQGGVAYITDSSQFHGGKDLRRKPYTLFRVRIDAQPVLHHQRPLLPRDGHDPHARRRNPEGALHRLEQRLHLSHAHPRRTIHGGRARRRDAAALKRDPIVFSRHAVNPSGAATGFTDKCIG